MLLDAWRLALGTMTAVPTRPPALVDRARAGLALSLAPLAAAPLAVAVVAVMVAGGWLGLPALVTAILAVGVLALGNRGFHLDGLSDTVDGLAASYDRERSLQVMKSGTSGPAGTVAVILVIGVQAAAIASLVPQGIAGAVLVGICVCASRAALVCCGAHGIPSARPGGLGDSFAESVSRRMVVFIWLASTVAVTAGVWWVGLPWWRGLSASVVALAVVLLIVARTVRRFGGVTGDVFGASVELALAALLVALS